MQKINKITTVEETLIDPFIRIEEGVTMANILTNGHCKISKGTFVGNSKIDKYFSPPLMMLFAQKNLMSTHMLN